MNLSRRRFNVEHKGFLLFVHIKETLFIFLFKKKFSRSENPNFQSGRLYLTDAAGHKSKQCNIKEICDYYHSRNNSHECQVHRIGIQGSVNLNLFMQTLSSTLRKKGEPGKALNHLLKMKKSRKISTDCLGVLIDTYTSDGDLKKTKILARKMPVWILPLLIFSGAVIFFSILIQLPLL